PTLQDAWQSVEGLVKRRVLLVHFQQHAYTVLWCIGAVFHMALRQKCTGHNLRNTVAGVTADAAIRRLQEAFEVFQRTPQGQGQQLEDQARVVVKPDIMEHPSGDVRLWAAKCLAEVLMIFVPKPPIERDRISSVLQSFTDQMVWLSDPAATNYKHAFDLFRRLVDIRGFMLVFETAAPEVLLADLVKSSIVTVRKAVVALEEEEFDKLENLLAQLLSSVLAEADELSDSVLNVLVDEVKQKTKSLGLVQRVLATLARHSAVVPVNDFLNRVLAEAFSLPPQGREELLLLPSTTERVEAILLVVHELYMIDPALVARVLPNLQAELVSSDAGRRRAVTALVGHMLAHRSSRETKTGLAGVRPLLAASHPLIVDRHRERLEDADDGVRSAALDGAGAVLRSAASVASTQPVPPDCQELLSVASALVTKLKARSLDPNDSIRMGTINVVLDVAAESTAGFTLLEPILQDVCHRILDKKAKVREACAELMARLYAKHALPKWIIGQAAERLNWIPQQLCEAYLVLNNTGMGQVSQLEEHIEQHILGCGAGMGAAQRSLALLGFYSSAAAGAPSSSQGLALLLSKKRDANEAFQRFLKKRIAKGGPLMPLPSDGILVPVSVGEAPREEVVEGLAKHSPTFEGSTKIETIIAQLSVLDGVRDKALWSLLQLLISIPSKDHPDISKLLDALKDLDRLLRVHNLVSLTPLIRRALLCTWVSPDQVSVMLDLWTGRWPEAFQRDEEPVPRHISSAARACAAHLPKFFPDAFFQHTNCLLKIATTSAEDAHAGLKALAAVAKRTESVGDAARSAKTLELGDVLLQVCEVACGETLPCGMPFRKAVKALMLSPDPEGRALAADKWLMWARDKLESGEDKVAALSLASAVFEQDFPGGLFHGLQNRDGFLTVAQGILASKGKVATDLRFASAECVVAAGSEEDVLGILSLLKTKGKAEEETTPWYDPQPAQIVCCLLRVLRSGRLQISTKLLLELASRMCVCLESDRPTCESEKLLDSLQRLQHPSSTKVRLADRLRLCLTIPLVFAFSPVKKHREVVNRMLQASFMKASRRAEEHLLEFAIACFIHFLSTVEIFRKEMSAPASSFPNSSKMCSFLCEALLRSDSQHCMELAWTVIQVCDRTLDFVDREEPASDAVHKAASVLRYVIEKRCPSLAGQVAETQVTKGGMPSELFAARQLTAQRALPGTGEQPGVKTGEDAGDGSLPDAMAKEPPKDPSSPGTMQTPRKRPSLLQARRRASPEASDSGRSSVVAVARPMAGKALAVPSAWSTASKKRRQS
ncbi:Pds5a, partial [Symbiodinium necroappetens]